MKLIHGAVLGAVLLSAPAVAFAGGGGLAGATGHPVTAAIPGSSTNSGVAFARIGSGSTATDGSYQATSGTYQTQPNGSVVPFNSAMSVANQRGGGH